LADGFQECYILNLVIYTQNDA